MSLNVLFLSSEVVPFSKTGGLADVSGALPDSLKALGCDVRVFTPLYRSGKRLVSKHSEAVVENLSVPVGALTVTGNILQSHSKGGVPFFLLDCDQYYGRRDLYRDQNGDFSDNAERFIFYCRSALEFCIQTGFKPDMVHCNDWQCGLVPAYLRHIYQDNPSFRRAACVFTIHNIAYQGNFGHDKFSLTGLPASLYTMAGLEFWGNMSMLKSGLVYSDAINTVSPTYSREIQTEAFGCGLEGVLSSRSADLYGILNGADYREWDPLNDKHIAARYSAKSLWRKKKCKLDLLADCGLPATHVDTPLLGIISRLTEQKGFDLLEPVVKALMDRDLALVVLGTGDQKYHRFFKSLKHKYSDKIYIKLDYDNKLAHKIEAGCDIFLMPSKYEPCGLNQIYSLKYGTAPIVRATGGLDDTIEAFDPNTGRGNGFKFDGYSSTHLMNSVERALSLYKDKTQWRKLVMNGMQADFSWQRSAKEYLKLYRKILKKR